MYFSYQRKIIITNPTQAWSMLWIEPRKYCSLSCWNFRQDQVRADSIHSTISLNSLEKTSLQSKPGISIGTGKYQVSMGFGSPKTVLSLVFDTASQLTWTQCQPCSGYCYDQREPIFNPSKSSSYTNILCPSATCNQISSQGTWWFRTGLINKFKIKKVEHWILS